MESQTQKQTLKEKNLVVDSGQMGGGMGEIKGIRRYKHPVIKSSHVDEEYSAGNTVNTIAR